MKRIWITAVSVMIIMALWSTYLMSQTNIPSWKPVISVPAEIEALVGDVAGLNTRMEVVEAIDVTGLKARVGVLEAQVASLEADSELQKEGLLVVCLEARSSLSASIAYIGSKPAGYMVTVSDPDSSTGRSKVSRDTCVANNNAALMALDAYIALLQL